MENNQDPLQSTQFNKTKKDQEEVEKLIQKEFRKVTKNMEKGDISLLTLDKELHKKYLYNSLTNLSIILKN